MKMIGKDSIEEIETLLQEIEGDFKQRQAEQAERAYTDRF